MFHHLGISALSSSPIAPGETEAFRHTEPPLPFQKILREIRIGCMWDVQS